MSRTISFDLSHLTARTTWPFADGITNVDLAFGRHFLAASPETFVRYGLRGPVQVDAWYAKRVIELADRIISPVSRTDENHGLDILKQALEGGTPLVSRATQRITRHLGFVMAGAGKLAALKTREFVTSRRRGLRENAVYLNVGQFLFEHDWLFQWLPRRPDVRACFLIHDLLPLDYPEFFLPIEARAFQKRIAMALNRAHGFVVTSAAVAERLEEELRRRHLPGRPILVQPLPSPLERSVTGSLGDAGLAQTCYFVMIGTLEPRKNHQMLLALWRQMAERDRTAGKTPPKLVLVGRNGWMNAHIRNEIERGGFIKPHIIESPHLSQSELSRLLANARALLMPSFAEGYGLPLVEALSLGTPVVVTDRPVFREVTQQKAHYCGALDGAAWLEAIDALADPASARSLDLRAAARQFKPPRWSGYFDAIERFARSL